MKDSGIEWIGEIPEDWEVTPLGKYFRNRVEKVSDLDFEPLSVTKQGVVKQLENAAKSANHNDRKKVCMNDFVINSRSDRKQSCGLSPYEGSVSLINIVLEINDLFPNYVKYLLDNYGFAEEFYRWGTGIVADLWSTRFDLMKKIPLPIPLESEQQAIANFLDQKVSEIDHILEKTRESIEEYKKYKQSLITEAVTKGLNPDVEMKNSGVAWIGEIPKHWGVGTIGRLFDYIGGYAFNSNNFSNEESSNQVLRIGNIRNDCIILDDKQVFVSDEIVKPIARFKIEYDDILFSMTGTKGKRDYFYTVRFGDNIINKNLFINQRVGCLRKRAKISPRYYNYLLKDIRILDSIFLYETGTANQGNLGIETIKRTKIQVPPYEEQQQISKFLSFKCTEIDSLISQKETLLSDLETYKKSLIYECVTGKREVD